MAVAASVAVLYAIIIPRVISKYAPNEAIIEELTRPLTVAAVMDQLKNHGVFDWKDPGLSPEDMKGVAKLGEELELWVLSRSRQPFVVQSSFVNLNQVETVFKELESQGAFQPGFVEKFHWDRIKDATSAANERTVNEDINKILFI